MKGNTQLRQENIRRLLNEIRERAPITKRDLQDVTGFSWGNISFITNKLLADRYIVPSGKQATTVGRKPEEYDINTEDNFIIGIDMFLSGYLLVVTDLRGRPVYKYKTEFTDKHREQVLNALYSGIDTAIEQVGREKIRYIAMGVQGLVDTHSGLSIGLGDLKDWSNVPLQKLMEERYQLPTMLVHDPDCLLRTEMSHGALHGTNTETALLIRMEPYGMGMSIMMNGRLCTGAHGRAGEIGRMLLPVDNESGYSYLDWITPENVISARYSKLTGNPDAHITYDQLAELARNNDPAGLKLFHSLTVAIGMLLINLVNLFNPDYVILFGELRRYSDLYLSTLVALLEENAYDTSVRLCLSDQKEDAAAVGAALWAADRVMSELYFVD